MRKLSTIIVLIALVLGNFYFARAQQGSSYPPVLIQAANVVTDASGNWRVDWANNFSSATPFVTARSVVPSGNNPVSCDVATRGNNFVTGWCRISQPTLLNLSIITTGLTLNPFPNAPATGTVVMVAARDTTQ